MAYRKGELTRRRKIVDWPHHVFVPIPVMGLGTRLNDMHSFCVAFDHQTASARAPGKPDGCLWCFRSAADAERFEAGFAELVGADGLEARTSK